MLVPTAALDPRRPAWGAHVIYKWLSEEAELLGDMHTAVVKRENARIALADYRGEQHAAWC